MALKDHLGKKNKSLKCQEHMFGTTASIENFLSKERIYHLDPKVSP